MTARTRVGVGASLVALAIGVLAAGAPGAAGAKAISGKLNKRGYTVIAVAASGRAKAVRARRSGKFRLRRTAKVVTLHLRGPDGVYAGPIVVGREKRGRRAVLGVKKGAKLGKVKVKRRKGYAKVGRKPAKKFVDSRRVARAKRGIPIGARKFGRVRSRKTGGGAPGDLDLDGIPEPLDIDDDGDRIIDKNDRSPGGARASALDADEIPPISARLNLELHQTVNANATALSDQLIDQTLVSSSLLFVSILPGDSNELDCGSAQDGLSYCRPGGTGVAAPPGAVQPGVPVAPVPFPGAPGGPLDSDGDGFGTLLPFGPPPAAGFPGAVIDHNATSSQIGTGDVLITRVTTNGVESQYPSALHYLFATVPAVVSFSDSAGNSTPVSYPVPPGAPGTTGNGFPVSAGPDGNVVLTLTFWRPQRKPIPGESGDWIDVGGLIYSANVPPSPVQCAVSTMSESDPNLVVSPEQELGLGLRDTALDRPSSPANTFTYSLNLTQCLAGAGRPFNVGDFAAVQFDGLALGGGFDITSQTISFRRAS